MWQGINPTEEKLSEFWYIIDCLDHLQFERGLNIEIISGMAKGVDTVAVQWGKDNNHKVHEFPADWNKYGKSAGYKRNAQMLEEGKPDLVIAFPGGKGTAMMIELARKAGVEVIVFDGVT